MLGMLSAIAFRVERQCRRAMGPASRSVCLHLKRAGTPLSWRLRCTVDFLRSSWRLQCSTLDRHAKGCRGLARYIRRSKYSEDGPQATGLHRSALSQLGLPVQLTSIHMFSRVAAFALAALPLLAAATPLEVRGEPASSCSTGPIQCCNTVTTVSVPSMCFCFHR